MAPPALSPTKARRLVLRHARPLGRSRVALDDALFHVLAENVRSPIPLPSFDNSAMDGYALRAVDVSRASTRRPVHLRVRETIYAGQPSRRKLQKGECTRIMTGAPLPAGADAVLPIERAVMDDNVLSVTEPVARYRHVRRRGEEIARGARVLARGTLVHPGTIACLAMIGKATVSVVRSPLVAVIATGDETVALSERLGAGQIYDSNSRMIAAALRDMHIEPARLRHVKDHVGAVRSALRAALGKADVVIVIGGVSVGERDYVKDVLADLGVRQVFWRVSQKPGKPLFFGTKGRRLVFGLPGNPASAFTCFYMYVYPALMRMRGFSNPDLARRELSADGEIAPDKKRWRFLKARARSRGGLVTPLGKQGSHMITSLVHANGLIAVPPAVDLASSDTFEMHMLPYAEDMEDES